MSAISSKSKFLNVNPMILTLTLFVHSLEVKRDKIIAVSKFEFLIISKLVPGELPAHNFRQTLVYRRGD